MRKTKTHGEKNSRHATYEFYRMQIIMNNRCSIEMVFLQWNWPELMVTKVDRTESITIY